MMLSRFAAMSGSSATNQDWELRDVRDGHLVWSRYFPHEVPAFSVNQAKALLKWPVADAAARDELARFPELKNSMEKTDYFLEQIDLQNNTAVGALVVKTNKGSFRVTHAFSVADWVIASATDNQVLTYSLATGQQKGHFFGAHPSASPNGLLAVDSESGQLSIYDMANSQLKQQYTFPDPVSFKAFSPDGSRIFVMTVSQTAYILDLTAKN